MAKERKFVSIEVLEEAAANVAAANNIPAMRAPPAPGGAGSPAGSGAVTGPAVVAEAVRAPTRNVDFFRVLCRDYVKKQLEAKRLELLGQGRRVTLSYLVLKALRADGYYIADEDFEEDGRRRDKPK